MRSRMALLDMTATELAEKVGISVGAISQFLNGKRNPKPVTADRIAKVLQTSRQELGL